MSLTPIETKLIHELIERHGMDTMILAIMAEASDRSLECSRTDQTDNEALWNVFADRMSDEYVWCKKHLY